MLDGSGNTDREVQLWTNRDPGGPDLPIVRHPSLIDDRSTGTHGPAEGVRQLLDEREFLGIAQSAAARDDDFGVCDVVFAAACGLHREEASPRSIGRDVDSRGFDRGGVTGFRGTEGPTLAGGDRRRAADNTLPNDKLPLVDGPRADQAFVPLQPGAVGE